MAATVEVSMASSLFMVLGYCLSGTRQSIVPLLRLKPKQPQKLQNGAGGKLIRVNGVYMIGC